AKLLHGEQFFSIKASIPTSSELITRVRSELISLKSCNRHTGAPIFENQSTVFIRGSGGFGGKRVGRAITTCNPALNVSLRTRILDCGAATEANSIPRRAPDAMSFILPEFAAIDGFDRPILHGLRSMGISSKHVFKTFGPFKDIKVRFKGVVYPGEMLVTQMWKEGPKVVFSTKVKERDSVVLVSAGVTLLDGSDSTKL
ncbi:hypothetical protein EDD85DRAFT_772333, partial [Armillaria nabsnona]